MNVSLPAAGIVAFTLSPARKRASLSEAPEAAEVGLPSDLRLSTVINNVN